MEDKEKDETPDYILEKKELWLKQINGWRNERANERSLTTRWHCNHIYRLFAQLNLIETDGILMNESDSLQRYLGWVSFLDDFEIYKKVKVHLRRQGPLPLNKLIIRRRIVNKVQQLLQVQTQIKGNKTECLL